MVNRQPAVLELITLLNKRADLKEGVEQSLKNAAEPDLTSLDQFYDYLDSILTHIPTENELMPSVRRFYFVLDKSPGGLLRKDNDFNEWINGFVRSRGDFLDTPGSADCVHTFAGKPEFKIDDYIKGPSGWLSFNQFLARQVKPGKRPVAAKCDDSVIVSPADSTFKGQWPVTKDSTIEVKGETYSIKQLLEGSNYRERFTGGIFTHSFLGIEDYHRYHVPVSGQVLEVRTIQATTWINESRNDKGELTNVDDVGFQFRHTRACVIIDSPVSLVAVMPIGMGHISSAVITAEEGIQLSKGDEFGYFAFGGSDMIMLFEREKAVLTAKIGHHYKQGEQIGIAKTS